MRLLLQRLTIFMFMLAAWSCGLLTNAPDGEGKKKIRNRGIIRREGFDASFPWQGKATDGMMERLRYTGYAIHVQDTTQAIVSSGKVLPGKKVSRRDGTGRRIADSSE